MAVAAGKALRQVARVLEPEVAALLQFGAALLFGPANRVDGLVDELDDVEFVEVIWALGRLSAVPAMTAGLMSMHTSSTASGFPPWAAKSWAKTPTVPASLPSATNRTRRRTRSTNRLT